MLHAQLFPALAPIILLSCLLRPALAVQEHPSPAPARDVSRTIGIVLFPDVELLDFAGPGEVFSSTHANGAHAFRVVTVAESKEPLSSQGFVTIVPQYSLQDCPHLDIVVVPGGHVPTDNAKLKDWVRARSKDAELMMSVCNGALLYGAAGLLDGLEATTHESALQGLALIEPRARVFTNRRFVDNGHVLTCAGVSAGIDGALHVVERLHGEEVAWQTARYMEYDWRPDEIAKLHAQAGKPVEGAEALALVASIRRLGVAGAAGEMKKLATPPTEVQLNRWGYTLMNSGKVDEAIDVFRVGAEAFPASSNLMDSLSEALEGKRDVEGARSAAQAALARVDKDGGRDDAARIRLRNSATSRLARLSGAGPEKLRFVCPPCNGPCDAVAYLEGGACPGCMMQLAERAP